ncbi:MAG: hypothetical protein ACXAC7_10615 [Candidatus Hodarchaeales archaeon]|jgi:hypothetical protein
MTNETIKLRIEEKKNKFYKNRRSNINIQFLSLRENNSSHTESSYYPPDLREVEESNVDWCFWDHPFL